MSIGEDRVSDSYRALTKSRILLLTGAGASAPFGMPTMDSLKDLIDEKWHGFAMSIKPGGGATPNDLEFLLGRLSLYESIVAERARDPLLQAWLGFQGENLGARAAALKEHIFDKIIRRYGRLSPTATQKAVSIYRKLYDELVVAAKNDPPVLPIFTTNYDLTFEAIQRADNTFRVCTGLYSADIDAEWRSETYRQQPYGFACFRLHGCSHWMKEKVTGAIVYQRLPDTKDPDYREPCVLYPVPGKEDRIYEEPFRTAYQHLDTLLRSATTVVIIGYSGRDPVIQAYLHQALEQQPSKRIVVVTGSETLRPGLEEIRERCQDFVHLPGGIEKNAARLAKIAQGEIELDLKDSMRLSE